MILFAFIIGGIALLVASIKIMDRMLKPNPSKVFFAPVVMLALALTAFSITVTLGESVVALYMMYASFVFYQVSLIDFIVGYVKYRRERDKKPKRW
ncbi:MAG: hypothetical protein ACOCU0_03610 [Bacillota bacterium]